MRPVAAARPAYTIRPNARGGDAWRLRLLRFLGPAASASPQPNYRAVIYKPERLGDFLLATPAIRALVNHWGAEQVALIVSPECFALADEEFPGLAKFSLPLRLGLGGWNVAQAIDIRRDLTQYSCDHLVCLRHHRQPLSSAALGWIPARWRWGTVGHPWMLPALQTAENGLLDRFTRYPWPSQNGLATELQAHADVVSHVIGTAFQARDLLPRAEPVHTSGTRDERPVLVIAPWTSSTLKSLPPDLLGSIVQRLASRPNLRIRILADSRQRPAQEAMCRHLGAILPDHDIAPARTATLAELRAAIAAAWAVLTADSFPAHLATAMDKPVAVLATGALPEVFGPWSHSPRQRWFTHQTDCWGCGWHCVHRQPNCLHDIAPDAVAEFLASHLDG